MTNTYVLEPQTASIDSLFRSPLSALQQEPRRLLPPSLRNLPNIWVLPQQVEFYPEGSLEPGYTAPLAVHIVKPDGQQLAELVGEEWYSFPNDGVGLGPLGVLLPTLRTYFPFTDSAYLKPLLDQIAQEVRGAGYKFLGIIPQRNELERFLDIGMQRIDTLQGFPFHFADVVPDKTVISFLD